MKKIIRERESKREKVREQVKERISEKAAFHTGQIKNSQPHVQMDRKKDCVREE